MSGIIHNQQPLWQVFCTYAYPAPVRWIPGVPGSTKRRCGLNVGVSPGVTLCRAAQDLELGSVARRTAGPVPSPRPAPAPLLWTGGSGAGVVHFRPHTRGNSCVHRGLWPLDFSVYIKILSNEDHSLAGVAFSFYEAIKRRCFKAIVVHTVGDS